MVTFDEEKQNLKLTQLRAQEEEDLARILSSKYNVLYADLTTMPINTDGLRLVKEERARESKLAVFNIIGRKLSVAVLSPNTKEVKQTISALEKDGYAPTLYMVSMRSLVFAWERYKDISHASRSKLGSIDIESSEIQKFIAKVRTFPEAKDHIDKSLEDHRANRISRVVEIFLAGAIAVGASDIHIEPEKKDVRLRFRLDGILSDVTDFDKRTYQLVLSRVKLLSGLKLNIKKDAQDGRFSVSLNESNIEIRTSILPSEYGESIVLRILNPDAAIHPLPDLGVGSDILGIITTAISQPNGMILTTGPTGSGKTTMLYAFLRKVYRPEIKVVTIEDPIEYHFPGIVQTQIDEKKGYSFAQGLRSILRQDPDVIMVGEIRDSDTATTAIHAALTGHLVLTTLHTNSAAGAFPRLINLGVDPRVMGASIRIAIAQRLLRKVCRACAKEVPLEGSDRSFVETSLAGARNQRRLNEVPNREVIWKAVGCDACGATGYKGRIGIFEGIQMDTKIEEIVRTSPSERELQEASLHQETLSMEQDGVLKALQGITTLEELIRVVGLGT